jgi:ribosomal protein S18 acetylase RimI-like enzyme
MEGINIYRISQSETDQLQRIGRQTFSETFSAVNTAENMEKYLAERFATDTLKAELADQNSLFYFAEFENRVIGYLKVNTGSAQTELQDDKALEIERIYVLKEFHGRKVGQKLFEKAVEVAVQADAGYVWLGVWEENQRALNFYKKNGFVQFGRHIFRLGSSEQTDIMMKLVLNKTEK